MEELKKVNGIHLSVKEEGCGTPVVLIHGRGHTKESMDILFAGLKDKYRVVSYDVRGHGSSDKPERFTLEDDARDLKALIESLSLRKPIVIGLSMGSYIALKTAEMFPGVFSKIVLLGTKGAAAKSSVQKILDQAAAEGLTEEQTQLRVRRALFSANVTDEQIDEYELKTAPTVPLTPAQEAAVSESFANFDLLADAHKVTIPVLLLTGDVDQINPPERAQQLADALPNARFALIPKAGHIAFFENPDAVFMEIDNFLDG